MPSGRGACAARRTFAARPQGTRPYGEARRPPVPGDTACPPRMVMTAEVRPWVEARQPTCPSWAPPPTVEWGTPCTHSRPSLQRFFRLRGGTAPLALHARRPAAARHGLARLAFPEVASRRSHAPGLPLGSDTSPLRRGIRAPSLALPGPQTTARWPLSRVRRMAYSWESGRLTTGVRLLRDLTRPRRLSGCHSLGAPDGHSLEARACM